MNAIPLRDPRSRSSALGELEDELKPLMLLSLQGDRHAHRTLLSRLNQQFCMYFRRRLFDGADVEDLAQEALLALHLARGSYDPSQPFTPWAFAVARHKLCDHLRRLRNRRCVPLEAAGPPAWIEEAETPTTNLDLSRLLARLSPHKRRLVEDLKLLGLSVAETAERGGVSAATAKVSVHRSLKWLGDGLRMDLS